jgi:L-ascorbate metabolism protein UlaG (beta-lactamase superfamily)
MRNFKSFRYRFMVANLALAAIVTGCVQQGATEFPLSEHYDGQHFRNRNGTDKSLFDVFNMLLGSLSEAEDWPESVPNPEHGAIVDAVESGIRATYISHSTVLLQVDGLNILTDPVYSDRASPVSFAGPRRVRAPGITLGELPPIDLILISHNHYDHLDTDTLQAILRQQPSQPVVITGLGNGALIKALGFSDVRELDWDTGADIGGVSIHFVECQHRSGRGLFDQMASLWGSFVLETSAGRIYFAGDSGYSPHFKEQGDKWGPFTLALLPIGAYEPRWFMADIHLNPEEAVKAHKELRSEQSLAIHYGIFQLTYEGIDAPLEDLRAALNQQGLDSAAFWTLEPGQYRTIDPN